MGTHLLSHHTRISCYRSKFSMLLSVPLTFSFNLSESLEVLTLPSEYLNKFTTTATHFLSGSCPHILSPLQAVAYTCIGIFVPHAFGLCLSLHFPSFRVLTDVNSAFWMSERVYYKGNKFLTWVRPAHSIGSRQHLHSASSFPEASVTRFVLRLRSVRVLEASSLPSGCLSVHHILHS